MPRDGEAEAVQCSGTDIGGVVEGVRQARCMGVRRVADHQRHTLTGRGRRCEHECHQHCDQRQKEQRPTRARVHDREGSAKSGSDRGNDWSSF